MNSPTLLVLVKAFTWVALLMLSPPHTHQKFWQWEHEEWPKCLLGRYGGGRGGSVRLFLVLLNLILEARSARFVGCCLWKKKTLFKVGTDTPPQRRRRGETEQQWSNELQREWREGAAAVRTKQWIKQLCSDCVTAVMLSKAQKQSCGSVPHCQILCGTCFGCVLPLASPVSLRPTDLLLWSYRGETHSAGGFSHHANTDLVWKKNSVRLLTPKHTHLNKNVVFFIWMHKEDYWWAKYWYKNLKNEKNKNKTWTCPLMSQFVHCVGFMTLLFLCQLVPFKHLPEKVFCSLTINLLSWIATHLNKKTWIEMYTVGGLGE